MVTGEDVLVICVVVAMGIMFIGLPVGFLADASIHDKRFMDGLLLDKYEVNGTYYTVWPTETLEVHEKFYLVLVKGQQYGYYTTDGVVVDVWGPHDEGL